MTNEFLKYHREVFQSCNINFLIGSGLSRPFLPTLGNIELQIEKIENSNSAEHIKEYALAALFNKYFNGVMYPNRCILSECPAGDRVSTYNTYKAFIGHILYLLRKRHSTIINKQINVFTTNIDLFLEKAIESHEVDINDGFSGKIAPQFSLSNYNKLVSKSSHMYDYESKLPIINLLKLHGSLNWRYGSDNKIECVYNDSLLETIKTKSENCGFFEITDEDSFDKILENATSDQALYGSESINEFMAEFYKLPLVNPTKRKFADTTLNLNYYEMLRFFSNELEKENSALYILGFSMADEHIREILIRAAKSNPTLTIYIFVFDSKDALTTIKNNMANKSYPNIKYLVPDEEEQYTLQNINQYFFEGLIKII